MFTPFAFLVPVSEMAIAAIQPRIFVGGNFTSYRSNYTDRLVRIDLTGSAERTIFNQGSAGFGSTTSMAFATASNGQWYVGGTFTSYSGSTVQKLARLNTNGTLDTTFNTNVGTGPNLFGVYGVVVQSDDKVLAAGAFATWNGTSINDIVRLNTNGTIDTTFNPGSGLNTIPMGMVKDALSDKVCVFGNISTYSGSSANQIVRINTNGTYDTTFNVGSGFNSTVSYIYPQSDGKLLVGGLFTTYSGSVARRVCRLNTDGTLDTTYTGWMNDGSCTWIDIQPDGKIVYAGAFQSYSGSFLARIARSNANGVLDTTFSIGTGFNGITNTITSLPGNKNLVAGPFTSYNGVTYNRIVLLDTSGSVDSTFVLTNSTSNNGTGNGFAAAPSFALRSGSFVYFGGADAKYKVPTYNYAVQLLDSGSVDSSFNTATGANTSIIAAVTESSGDLILGGGFVLFNGVNVTRVARVSKTGTTYPSSNFNPGTGPNSLVYDLKLQSDGKIVAVGLFSAYSGSSSNGVVRINTNGTRDTTYNVGTGLSSVQGYVVVMQSDDKAIVGGNFTSYSGSTSNNLVRINTDGTRDATFNIGTGFSGTIGALALQSDGKVVVGGSFTSFNGTSGTNRTRLIRVNTDGTFDSTFASGAGPSGAPTSIRVQSDGKILVHGGFTSYSGSSYNRLIRLNSNGTIDTSFNVGTGFDNATAIAANSLLVDPSGSVFVASEFTSYSGSINLGNFIKLRNSGSIDTSFTASDGSGAVGGHGFSGPAFVVLHYNG